MSDPAERGNGHLAHLDSEVLAEFRAGLVTGHRGEQVAAHLAACDQCTAVDGQLAEVRVLLAAAPLPVLPAALAERLDTVLAAELNHRTEAAERAAAGQSAPPVKHPRRADRSRWRLVGLRVLAPAAAVAVLAGGAVGLSRLSSSPTGSTAASAPVPAASASVTAGSAARRPPAAGVPGAAGGSGSRPGMLPDIKSHSFRLVTSGTDFRLATLAQQVEAEIRTAAATQPSQTPSAQLEGCVSRLTQGVSPGTVRLVENAKFQGQPATVIVASSGSVDRAWVLAPGCSASSDHVLATTTLPGISTP